MIWLSVFKFNEVHTGQSVMHTMKIGQRAVGLHFNSAFKLGFLDILVKAPSACINYRFYDDRHSLKHDLPFIIPDKDRFIIFSDDHEIFDPGLKQLGCSPDVGIILINPTIFGQLY
jgi:hypothetical protein